MEQFKQFAHDKQVARERLSTLAGLIGQLGGLGFDVQNDLATVVSAEKTIEAEVLRVALIGAFSDGKTSVVAAWLGQVMDDMKIDMDESSDQVLVYRPHDLPEQCEIVDTPGLFGDKVRTIDERPVLFADMTKQYISGAHLLLYVVDATNPLKDSHGEIVRWLLRDLDKLESTVFVINKMDEVTDLTEEELFRQQAEIKTENIVGKLKRFAALTPDETRKLRIVCISADPNGRGLPYWFTRPAQYEARSRIAHLKAVTQEVLSSTVPEVLRAKTALDVTRDMVARKLSVAEAQLGELLVFETSNQQERTRIREDIKRGRVEVKRMAAAMFDELRTLEAQLLAKLRPLEIEDLQAYMDDEIGMTGEEIGFKLQLRIKAIINRYTEEASDITGRIAKDIELQLEAGASFIAKLSGQALTLTGQALSGLDALPTAVIRQGLLAARDVLAQVTGVAIKFQPWEVFKLAATISKLAGPVAAGIQVLTGVWQAYQAHEKETALQTHKSEINNLVKESFKAIYDVLREDDVALTAFAPQLKEFEKVLRELDASAASIKKAQQTLSTVRNGLSALLPVGNRVT
jgi:GTPase Era involved in 16S rRNA processing